jgi:hypothetical protein
LIDFAVTHRGEGVLSDPGVADVTEHLVAEFGARIDRSAISGVVLRSILDLQCSPAAACTVGLERLTRDRLRALLDEDEPRARPSDRLKPPRVAV